MKHAKRSFGVGVIDRLVGISFFLELAFRRKKRRHRQSRLKWKYRLEPGGAGGGSEERRSWCGAGAVHPGILEQIGGAKVAMDTMWTLIAGMLVFFMNLGFATVESGLCRAKNAVTILAKNFIVFAASSLAFLAVGMGVDVR